MFCVVLDDLSLAFFECVNFTFWFRLNAVMVLAP